MTDPRIVAVFGTQSRQDFITANNRLKQSIGASKLIEDATDYWNNCRPGQMIYVGGGVGAVLFENRDQAVSAMQAWSLEFAKIAPELRLAAGWAQVAQHKSIADAWRHARVKSLAAFEELSPLGDELRAFPITRTCPDTGGAASAQDQERNWVSAEARGKLDRYDEFQRLFDAPEDSDTPPKILLYKQRILGDWYVFPSDFEDLGIREGARHIAIIHIDGNGIGELLEELNKCSNEVFAAAVRDFSGNLTESALGAVLSGLGDLRDRIPMWQKSKILGLSDHRDGRTFFPVRPLVDGGDDITLICHGKLGIGLACRICLAFEKLTEQHFKDKKTACAGVAIIQSGFPFQRAYQLAADLCNYAKTVRKNGDNQGKNADMTRSWIDFHVTVEGSQSDLESIRRESYRKKILGRPYSLGPGGTYGAFEAIWRAFALEAPWRDGRSRAKAFLEAIASGDSPAKHTANVNHAQGYPKPERPGTTRTDYQDYFDALELLDFHVSWDIPVSATTETKNA